MAMEAVGWLSGKLGLDIAGRNKEVDRKESKDSVGGVFSQWSTTLFGGGADPRVGTDGEALKLDREGLPQGRDWFRYDEALKRWVPTEHAPANVHEEHAARVRQEEEEAAGGKKFPAPPPPPPPPAATMHIRAGSDGPAGSPGLPMRSPTAPQYADMGFFGGGPAPAPAAPVPAASAYAPPPAPPAAFVPGTATAHTPMAPAFPRAPPLPGAPPTSGGFPAPPAAATGFPAPPPMAPGFPTPPPAFPPMPALAPMKRD